MSDLEVFMRRAPLTAASAGDEARVRLSFSSEQPLRRYIDGVGECWEVLSHRAGDVDLSRLDGGRVPLLVDHKADLDHQVGRVARAWIEGGRGLAEVIFSDTAAGQEMLARVQAGDVGSVSVGYQLLGYTLDGERDGIPVARVRWQPFEVSLVAVPADPSVGVGRAQAAQDAAVHRRATMPEQTETRAAEPAQNDAGARSVRQERHRVAEIMAIGQRFDLPAEDVQAAISDGTPLERFRAAAMDAISSEAAEQPIIGMRGAPAVHSRAEQPYSLVRAIAALESGRWDDAGFERECAQELQHRAGRAAQGVHVPLAAFGKRDLLTTANAGELIGTDHMGSAFTDVLRPASKVVDLGATMMPGLRGQVQIPRMTAGTAAEWIGEDAAATESTPEFDQIDLELKQLSARASMSRRQVKQADPALEAILRRDLIAQIGTAMDRAAINGAGSATEPRGVLNLANLTTIDVGADGNTGGEIVYPAVAALLGALEANDVVDGRIAFLTNPAVAAQMLGKPIFQYGSQPMLQPMADGSGDAMLANRRLASTSNVPNDLTKGTATDLSALIVGRWADVLVGMWGGLDILLDPYTDAPKGNVRIVAHAEMDISVRYDESFAAITDISTELTLGA